MNYQNRGLCYLTRDRFVSRQICFETHLFLTSQLIRLRSVFNDFVRSKTRNGSCFHKSLGVSYITIRDDFTKYILPFVLT